LQPVAFLSRRQNLVATMSGPALSGDLLFARRGVNRGHFALPSKPLPALGSTKTLVQSDNLALAIAGWTRRLQPVAILSRRQTRA